MTRELNLPWQRVPYCRRFGSVFVLAVFALTVCQSVAADSDSLGRQPNILVILADDMGYGDTGFTGSRFLQTPRIDELARSGVFCSQGYVTSPVCSPSRAGLMTGRDPRRFGYEENLNKRPDFYDTRPELLGLVPGEHTLGDHLRAAGYATALVGKWHLGLGPSFHPNRRGFGYFCGMLTGSHSYFPKKRAHQIERNGERIEDFSHPYLTDFFTDEGIAWIDEQQDAEKPWFLFMSYNAPHGPLQALDADLERFSSIKNTKRRTYAAMMWALDRGVGRFLDWMEREEGGENTLIVFLSDNGGATSNASWNGPLSGAKGTLKEGGIRVPMFWRWPGRIPKGTTLDAPASSLDLLPTFLEAAGGQSLPLREALSHEHRQNFATMSKRYGDYEGVNLLPVFEGRSSVPDRKLFWRLQGQASIRWGEDKLIRLSHRPAQWFRPGKDVGEKEDLSGTSTERLGALFEELGRWESALPTVPLWGSSPYWIGQSAQHYDLLKPRPEPN